MDFWIEIENESDKNLEIKIETEIEIENEVSLTSYRYLMRLVIAAGIQKVKNTYHRRIIPTKFEYNFNDSFSGIKGRLKVF